MKRSFRWWLCGLSAAMVLAATHGSATATPAASQTGRAVSPRISVNGETLVGRPSPAPGIDAYLGLPFAESPVGARRWRAPVGVVGRGGTRQATAFAPACMQSMRILDWYRGLAERFGAERSVFPDLAISEDCLYLN
ncbi:MAG: carboxylesterase family protein, partial [Gammaproteobacteria bacterium]